MISSALKPCTITHKLVSWGILSIYDYYKLLLLNTSIPVEASMSRKTSTKFLTSLAALAFDTVLRNGLINLISPPSSKKQNYTHNQSIVASVTASRVHPSCLNKHSSTTIKKRMIGKLMNSLFLPPFILLTFLLWTMVSVHWHKVEPLLLEWLLLHNGQFIHWLMNLL